MKALLFFVSILSASVIYGQKIAVSGIILDTSKKPIAGAVIIDANGHFLADSTDQSGEFFFEAKTGLRFGVDVAGFELEWRTVRSEETFYEIVMDTKVQTIESIVITRRNSEEALDIKNVNIIHYQPLDGAILTLKKEKRTYYLGMDSLQKEGVSFPLDIERPKELFFDCFRNAYVLSADSAYQFVMLDTALLVLPGISLGLFDQYIRPCVSRFGDRLVMEQFTNLNKEYDLVLYDQQRPKYIFNRRDELGYQAAYEASIGVGKMVDPNDGDTLVDPVYLRRQQRRDVYGRHDTSEDFYRARAEQNETAAMADREAAATFGEPDSIRPLIPSRQQFGSQDAWRSSRSWASAMASYLLFTQPINIKTFQISNFMAVVDYDSTIVHVLDHNGYSVKSSFFDVEARVERAMQDKATGYLYLYVKDRGNHKVYGLNAFTGEVHYLKNFGGMPHTEQAIIYDGYLYYKVLERDFYGINRIRLPGMEFFASEE